MFFFLNNFFVLYYYVIFILVFYVLELMIEFFDKMIFVECVINFGVYFGVNLFVNFVIDR